jgi:hypothetical protein
MITRISATKQLVFRRQDNFAEGERRSGSHDCGDEIQEGVQTIFQEGPRRGMGRSFILSPLSLGLHLEAVGGDDFSWVKMEDLGVSAEKPEGENFRRQKMELISFQGLQVGESNPRDAGHGFKRNLFFFSLLLKVPTYCQSLFHHCYVSFRTL